MPVLFTNCAIIDTERGERLPGHDVLVEGDIIREVSDHPIKAPGATICDLAGRSLMPGLCDAHVHVTAVDADLGRLDRLASSYITARAVNVLNGMLRRGFTTVRDAGGADQGSASSRVKVPLATRRSDERWDGTPSVSPRSRASART